MGLSSLCSCHQGAPFSHPALAVLNRDAAKPEGDALIFPVELIDYQPAVTNQHTSVLRDRDFQEQNQFHLTLKVCVRTMNSALCLSQWFGLPRVFSRLTTLPSPVVSRRATGQCARLLRPAHCRHRPHRLFCGLLQCLLPRSCHPHSGHHLARADGRTSRRADTAAAARGQWAPVKAFSCSTQLNRTSPGFDFPSLSILPLSLSLSLSILPLSLSRYSISRYSLSLSILSQAVPRP